MFIPNKTDTGHVQPWEYFPAAAGSYKVGQLLNVNGGKLAAITAAQTTTPPYLCMAEITAKDGESVPVTRVRTDTIYDTCLSAAAANAAAGTMLEISAGGLSVDATANGSFEITYLDGTEAGAAVSGRFLAQAAVQTETEDEKKE